MASCPQLGRPAEEKCENFLPEVESQVRVEEEVDKSANSDGKSDGEVTRKGGIWEINGIFIGVCVPAFVRRVKFGAALSPGGTNGRTEGGSSEGTETPQPKHKKTC